jgi:hypothetical protein
LILLLTSTKNSGLEMFFQEFEFAIDWTVLFHGAVDVQIQNVNDFVDYFFFTQFRVDW